MTEPADRIPDASADAEARAAATEDYGGVPISDEEMAEVWQAPAAGSESSAGSSTGSDTTGTDQAPSDDLVDDPDAPEPTD